MVEFGWFEEQKEKIQRADYPELLKIRRRLFRTMPFSESKLADYLDKKSRGEEDPSATVVEWVEDSGILYDWNMELIVLCCQRMAELYDRMGDIQVY